MPVTNSILQVKYSLFRLVPGNLEGFTVTVGPGLLSCIPVFFLITQAGLSIFLFKAHGLSAYILVPLPPYL